MIVCHFMLSQRGIGRGSHIAGKSTHNQRIERLWRDVYRCVASTFHGIFYYMEEQQLLDPDSELDLFVLHCVFLPRINHSLKCFTAAWNQHPLRTERMWSPRKIWMNGIMRCTVEGMHRLDIVDPTPNDLESFGIDFSGPPPEAHQQVVVPDTLHPLSDASKEWIMEQISLCQESDDTFGFDTFCMSRAILYEMMEDLD